ncbi:MAG: Calx-beta domain-containing protein [Thalassovita sp.]
MLPTLFVSAAEIRESTDTIVFRVSLSEASLSDITVQYRAVQDGSALVGYNGDVHSSRAEDTFTLTIPAGSTQAEIAYSIEAYDLDEFDENFTLELSDPVNAVLSGGEPVLTAAGVILDADGGQNLALFVSDPLVYETDAGGQQAVFEIRLSQPYGQSVTLNYNTADGTAQAGSDYVATSGSVTFAPGQTVTSVAVDIIGDTANETLETFSLVVTGVPTFIASEDSTGQAGIQDRPPLVGTEGNDILIGQDYPEIILGFGGNDRIDGRGGDDAIDGGDGADTLIGGGGDDSIVGGSSDVDLRDLIFGGYGNDTIVGGFGNDELRGDAGNDDMAGGAGADTVIGGTGNDVMTGSNFGDLLFGGDGFDFVNGGFGNDLVNGGADADRFFHVGAAGHGSDWIQDFSATEGDILLYGGSATIDQFQVNRANTANAGSASLDEAFVIYKPSGQILWALVDGFGNEEILVRIGGSEYDLLA